MNFLNLMSYLFFQRESHSSAVLKRSCFWRNFFANFWALQFNICRTHEHLSKILKSFCAFRRKTIGRMVKFIKKEKAFYDSNSDSIKEKGKKDKPEQFWTTKNNKLLRFGETRTNNGENKKEIQKLLRKNINIKIYNILMRSIIKHAIKIVLPILKE